jgi:hypothetical protein
VINRGLSFGFRVWGLKFYVKVWGSGYLREIKVLWPDFEFGLLGFGIKVEVGEVMIWGFGIEGVLGV